MKHLGPMIPSAPVVWTRHVDPRDRSPREANWPSFERGQPPALNRY